MKWSSNLFQFSLKPVLFGRVRDFRNFEWVEVWNVIDVFLVDDILLHFGNLHVWSRKLRIVIPFARDLIFLIVLQELFVRGRSEHLVETEFLCVSWINAAEDGIRVDRGLLLSGNLLKLLHITCPPRQYITLSRSDHSFIEIFALFWFRLNDLVCLGGQFLINIATRKESLRFLWFRIRIFFSKKLLVFIINEHLVSLVNELKFFEFVEFFVGRNLITILLLLHIIEIRIAVQELIVQLWWTHISVVLLESCFLQRLEWLRLAAGLLYG